MALAFLCTISKWICKSKYDDSNKDDEWSEIHEEENMLFFAESWQNEKCIFFHSSNLGVCRPIQFGNFQRYAWSAAINSSTREKISIHWNVYCKGWAISQCHRRSKVSDIFPARHSHLHCKVVNIRRITINMNKMTTTKLHIYNLSIKTHHLNKCYTIHATSTILCYEYKSFHLS